MKNAFRISMSAVALAALAACSGSSEPALTDDLQHDLAKVGGAEMQLVGSTTPRLDIVAASERTESPMPTPRARTVSRAPSATRGTRAQVQSVKTRAPTAAVVADVEDIAPAEVREAERQPEPVPAAAGRPQAPQQPHTNREPAGGWRRPSDVIRDAPFPIKP